MEGDIAISTVDTREPFAKYTLAVPKYVFNDPFVAVIPAGHELAKKSLYPYCSRSALTG